MENWLNDLRYAARTLRRNRFFAVTSILSLAVGIGANTAMFTIANGLLLRAPAGMVDPASIVDVGRTQNGNGFDNNSYQNYLDIRARTTAFTGLYAYRFGVEPLSLGARGGAERIYGSLVSNNYFSILGTRAAAGRLFSPGDPEVPGASPFVVLTHDFWMRRYNGDRSIVGSNIEINRQPFHVIGVAEEGFEGTTVARPDVWIPINMAAAALPREGNSQLTERAPVWLMMGGRLKPGFTVESAQAQLSQIGASLEREFPEANRGRGLRVLPWSRVPGHTAPLALFLGGLMIVAALVLLITCANLAAVLLARLMSRHREIAIRVAHGAGRSRIVRQMLAETAILAVFGAALGIALARAITSLLVALLPKLPIPIGASFPLDLRVLVFTAGVSILATMLAGLTPALNATRGNLAGALKSNAQSGNRRMRLRNAFVITQVALSIVLVACAALFIRALQRAADLDPGFDARGVEVTSLDLSLGGYDNATGALFVRELLSRLRAVPGVQAASTTAVVPLMGGGMGLGALYLPGRTTERDQIDTDWDVVSPGYFAAMRMPLLRGRDFDDRDRADNPNVAIINQTMADKLWPRADPLGKQLVQENHTLTIIGIARNAKYRTLGESSRMFIYVPHQQRYQSRVSLVVRTAPGRHVASETRSLLLSMNRSLPVISQQPLEELTAIGVLPQRIAASISGSLGVIGLLLAAIGVYGVTAAIVASRRREIAIRIAVGATRPEVVRMILQRGMTLVAIGVVIGTVIIAGASRVFASLLFGIGALDPIAFGVTTILFCLAGFLACVVPARRAARVEPAAALRAE